MIRATVTGEHKIKHLWTGWDATTTVCGRNGHPDSGWVDTTCEDCLRGYGAELAAAFSHLRWLCTETGMTRHAFDDAEQVTASGERRPVCGIRSYSPARLHGTRLKMRCPHCLHLLQQRRDRAHA